MYIYIQCSYQQWCLEDILLPSIKIWLCVCSPSRSKKYKSKPNILVGIIQPVKSTIWCRFKTLAGHKTICQLLYLCMGSYFHTHTKNRHSGWQDLFCQLISQQTVPTPAPSFASKHLAFESRAWKRNSHVPSSLDNFFLIFCQIPICHVAQ